MKKHILCTLLTGMLPVTLLATGQSFAHQLWIEPAESNARMHYGYLDRNLREVTPGRLDEIVKPIVQQVTAGGNEHSLTLVAQRNHLELILAQPLEKEDTLLLIYDNGPAYEQQGISTHWTMASRFISDHLSVVPMQLELDITPTGHQGSFRVTLLGEPLANQDIRLATEYGWGMNRRTDEQGVVSFPSLPWEGLYIISTHHTIDAKGERERTLADGSTEQISHDRRGFQTTLTFIQEQGLPALESLPLSPPYESGTRAQ